jgi:Domain of unknown function (DUF4157)
MRIHAVRARRPKPYAPEPAAPSWRGAADRDGAGTGAALDLSRVPVFPPPLQAKLVVGDAQDPLENEADRAAERVMAMSGAAPPPPIAGAAATLRRAPAPAPATATATGGGEAPASVHETVGAPGAPLGASERAFFEPRFHADFGDVRIHADPRGAASAAAIGARAYTVGRDVAFAAGEYRPASDEGRGLIAHELAHVVQQDGGDAAAAGTVRRLDTDAVGQVMKMDSVIGAGLQFYPAWVTDTVIGPVSVQGALLGHQASRLSVIVGQNLTPRKLARQILPLWRAATPATPPSGGAPLPLAPLSEDQLAQGLIAYNRYYLQMPRMTEWRAGLHFPLPVEFNEATTVATVNIDLILALAGGFDPAWQPLLDQPAAATVAPPAATVRADAAAFLAANTDPIGRGIALAARALTNAQAALPFVREVFVQLGAGAFDVALAMADQLVVRDIGLLTSERDGDAIVARLAAALRAAPAGLDAAKQARLTRANALLVSTFGAASDPAAPATTRPEKQIAIDTVKLDGSSFTPATQIAVANMIYSQCNVRLVHGIDATATPAQSAAWVGADGILNGSATCKDVSAEERGLFNGAAATFGLSARFRAFFARDINLPGVPASGASRPPSCATGSARPFSRTMTIVNSGDTSTLAHELGHVLIDPGDHLVNTVMGVRPRPNEINNAQCAAIYRHA